MNDQSLGSNNQLAISHNFYFDEDIRFLLEANKNNPSFQLTDTVKKRLRDINKKGSNSKIIKTTHLVEDYGFQNKNLFEQLQNQIDSLKESKSSIQSDGFFAALIKWNYKIDASN